MYCGIKSICPVVTHVFVCSAAIGFNVESVTYKNLKFQGKSGICIYVTVLRKNGLIAGLAKIDFFSRNGIY